MKYKRNSSKSYKNYRMYKRYLRIDFGFKCVYCHRHENAYNSYREFEIDHLRPKSSPSFAHLVNDYSNLVYSCPDCNNMKGDSWPSDNPLIDQMGWLDPCEHDFDNHYRLYFDGQNLVVKINTNLGKWMAYKLGFDQKARLKNIEKWYEQLYMIRKSIIMAHKATLATPRDRKELASIRRDLMRVYRLMVTPEPYIHFNRRK